MAIAIVLYFLTFLCVVKFKRNKIKYSNFPKLKLNKHGIFFNSNLTHRIKIDIEKICLIGNNLYIKCKNNIILIKNVKDVKIFEGFLYFLCLGEVEILFDFSCVFRYFGIDIKTKKFDFKKMKQMAICDLINNNFDIDFSKIAKNYIKIIKNVLKINIFDNKISIMKNNLNIDFMLTYKLNGKIKRVYIE